MIKTFWRDTYQSRSPIPFIISIQVFLFVVIHIFDLLTELNIIYISLYDLAVKFIGLSNSFFETIYKPWSIITFPFLYTDLFKLLFDCLFLYWFGNIFLNFLNRRQFLFVCIKASLLGGILFLSFNQIAVLHTNPAFIFHGSTFSLVAIITAISAVVPHSQVRLFLLGNVSLKFIAIIYLAIKILTVTVLDKSAALTIVTIIGLTLLYIHSLKNGKDWSLIFTKENKQKLKVIHTSVKNTSTHSAKHKADLPNQEEVDAILDKISVNGYDNLSRQEKETLFKASRTKG
ncbi:rhomboid family intramembrane serine protease [Sphingobacterium sp. UT-1RO-CII-1]|uniref:rhomboid family intramembrane serine protease n=1 Tax=Sphingobacterium sp. UT-1RO-CII-1 TaxID=2995225 RepID=UPI00227BEDC8|nr:rhomboid family intramembrane serine protease [Sphingobacterium sp. UT-1RO-CII-1]MCY4778449.1 rhomboid family intramembrane serine protease [Sphingobacterium sp. UT-1RO-CII-1]